MERARKLRGALAAPLTLIVGIALVYSGWQSAPGREEIVALGVALTIVALVGFAVLFLTRTVRH
jgi:hypothetical protein